MFLQAELKDSNLNRKKQLTGSKKAVEWSALQGVSEKDWHPEDAVTVDEYFGGRVD